MTWNKKRIKGLGLHGHVHAHPHTHMHPHTPMYPPHTYTRTLTHTHTPREKQGRKFEIYIVFHTRDCVRWCRCIPKCLKKHTPTYIRAREMGGYWIKKHIFNTSLNTDIHIRMHTPLLHTHTHTHTYSERKENEWKQGFKGFIWKLLPSTFYSYLRYSNLLRTSHSPLNLSHKP